mmetsp:Transcript_26262/g.72227  ORF Transcript_26262/g.72227 Transcript_26262/m.72227 type:complete len:203 (-) Transcript_26262:388-996(-)
MRNCWSNSWKSGKDWSRKETVGSRCAEMMDTSFLRKYGKSSIKFSTLDWRISHRLQRVSACTVALRVGAMPSIASSPKMPPMTKWSTLRAVSLSNGLISNMGLTSSFFVSSAEAPHSMQGIWFRKTEASPETMMNMESPVLPSSTISSLGRKIRSTDNALSFSTNSKVIPSKKGAFITSPMSERRNSWSMSAGGTLAPLVLA